MSDAFKAFQKAVQPQEQHAVRECTVGSIHMIERAPGLWEFTFVEVDGAIGTIGTFNAGAMPYIAASWMDKAHRAIREIVERDVYMERARRGGFFVLGGILAAVFVFGMCMGVLAAGWW